MQKQVKIDTIAELQETLAKVSCLVVADFRGLKVEEVNGLRREIRKSDCKYRVVKNKDFQLHVRCSESRRFLFLMRQHLRSTRSLKKKLLILFVNYL